MLAAIWSASLAAILVVLALGSADAEPARDHGVQTENQQNQMQDSKQNPMAGKSVLITGGTGGIGRATAIGLAKMGARVGITGRDATRTKQAAADIRSASGNPAVDAFAADMATQAEIRRLAAAVLEAYPRLDVLVNNVGGFWAHRHITADGLEFTFALNHLAPYLLTNLLLDRLRASAPARVVTVSSGAHARGRIDFDDLQGARGYSGNRAYSQSKLANILFSNELARRLEGTGVTANSLHPGVVGTNFGAEDQARFFTLVKRLVLPILKTPEQGAQTSIYVASSPELDGVTGQYFANRKPKRASKAAYDQLASGRLWEVSSELVGGKPEEQS
jgi:NAD(P)-dependent dehydrogenase (short-subunit alcohol dehydrogenase family)